MRDDRRPLLTQTLELFERRDVLINSDGTRPIALRIGHWRRTDQHRDEPAVRMAQRELLADRRRPIDERPKLWLFGGRDRLTIRKAHVVSQRLTQRITLPGVERKRAHGLVLDSRRTCCVAE